ncbi:hypothetical protein GJ744_006448 [Endocarpon pusillum]|uniref:aldehyde dehydrogenase (NAD(+)) n=1 Tax=Endocarpon pusillum TaxID=364733 RepID=A0A8H7E810_9EURO|nr:hypothetical protein GJ744_006448 [Endocarpon pusillum]
MAPSKLTTVDFNTFANIVNGEPRSAKNKYNGIDPTTKEKLWDVPVASKEDVEDAVRAANEAYRKWSKKSWEERQEALNRFKDLYASYVDDLTELLLKEVGRPKCFSELEIKSCLAFTDWHMKLSQPEPEQYEDDEKTITTRFLPLGVVAAICPWNYPVTLSVGKIVPAVLAGNAIIVKPSPFTPYSALKVVEIAQQVFPPGLVQALGGDDKLGPALVAHPDIQIVSFTGSIATGKKVMAAAASTLKRVTLELGGNDPCIILPDVDIAKTAPQVALGAFLNSGQICVAIKRIYIHKDIYRPFVDALISFTEQLKIGTPKGENVMLGPLQNEMQYEKVKTFFEDSKKNGYKFVAGTDNVEEGKGYFIKPAIIDNPPNDSKIVTEEPFGPIVPCQPWEDEAEVIARANNTKAGLAASVFGKDLERCERIANQIESGSVFINSFAKPRPMAIFGGMKESGIGGEWGKLGMLSFMIPQAIHRYK